jgi:predicted P-loop ATPase
LGEDKRKYNSGTKGNKGGRPSKVDELQANYIFTEAIKRITNKDEESEAKIQYIVELAEFERGRMWIADKTFGKPKEGLDVTTNGDTFKNPFILFGKEKDE